MLLPSRLGRYFQTLWTKTELGFSRDYCAGFTTAYTKVLTLLAYPSLDIWLPGTLLRLEHGPRKTKGHLGLQILLTLVNTAASNDAHCSVNILRRYI